MIGFLPLPFHNNNNNNNHNNRSHHESFSLERRFSVTLDVYGHENPKYSISPPTNVVRRRHDATTLLVLSFFYLTMMMNSSVLALTTPRLPTVLTKTPHGRSARFLSSVEWSTTTDVEREQEGLITMQPSSFSSSTAPLSFLYHAQQQQQFLWKEPRKMLATWLLAPAVLLLLAVPPTVAADATMVAREACNNLAFAIFPENPPDFVSLVLGEGMGYATYFAITAMAISSLLSNGHQQEHHEYASNMVSERETSLMTANHPDHEHSYLQFAPVDGSTEEDALVPCAFAVVEQTLPLPSSDMFPHSSLFGVEIFFDVTKWLSFFVLQQSDLAGTLSFNGVDPLPPLVESAVFGFVAGFGAKFYADALVRYGQVVGPERRLEMTRTDWPWLCLMEATSAASLFTVYEAVQTPVHAWMECITQHAAVVGVV